MMNWRQLDVDLALLVCVIEHADMDAQKDGV